MEYSGAEGKLIHEKNQRPKISWHCPFKNLAIFVVSAKYFELLLIMQE